MSGGGGSSVPSTQHTSSTVQQNTLPAYAQPYVERAFRRSEVESLQPYTPYGGQRLAYFSPDELNAQAMTRGFAGAGTPQQYTDASTRFGNISSYSATPFDNQAIADRMNPYQQNVIDIQKREAQRRSEMAGDKISDAAKRKEVMHELTGPLSKDQREIMVDLLENVQTDGLRKAFDKYIPAVIDGKTPAKKKATLTESEAKEITGNKESNVSRVSQEENNNIIHIQKLAGLK